MIHQIEIPDNVIPADKIPVAFRPPLIGETFAVEDGMTCIASINSAYPRLILEPVKKLRPLTIEEACKAMCQKQQFSGATITAVHCPGSSIVYDGRCMNLKDACDTYQVGVLE